MIMYVALPYQACQLTGSSLVVGLVSLAELGPLLATAFVGGALAGIRASIVSGGVLCVVGVALAAVALPAFRRYDAREHVALTEAAEPVRS